MRVVIQRVKEASVSIEGRIHATIGAGLLILLGIETADTNEDIAWLCGKIARLRIFDDANHVMNLSICDIEADCLLISQFTLHASTRKGNRPSYIRAATPDVAIPLYESFIGKLTDEIKRPVQTGVFGADMQVKLINDGPVTIIIDSKNKE